MLSVPKIGMPDLSKLGSLVIKDLYYICFKTYLTDAFPMYFYTPFQTLWLTCLHEGEGTGYYSREESRECHKRLGSRQVALV